MMKIVAGGSPSKSKLTEDGDARTEISRSQIE